MITTSLLAALVLFGAFFGESMFGFGGGLIAVPLLSTLLGIREAITLALIFQFCMGLLIFKTYKHIAWTIVLPMTGALVMGAVLGTFALARVNADVLRLILAVTILMFLVKEWFFKGAVLTRRPSAAAGNATGFTSGFITGLIGTGGPPIAMYLVAVIKDKVAVRASLIYLFFIINILRVLISIPQGLFTHQVLTEAAVAMPFFLVAIALGQTVHHRISERFYRQSIDVILLVSAVLLLAKVF